jgi:hypothetical protein
LETYAQHNTYVRRRLEGDSNELVRRLVDRNELSLLVDAVELKTPLPGNWSPELAATATGLLQQLFGGIVGFKKADDMRKLCGKRWPQWHGIALDTHEFVEGRQWSSGTLAVRAKNSNQCR